MKVWSATQYYKDDIHGDHICNIKLFKTEAKANNYMVKQASDPSSFYYIVEEYEVEQ